MACTLRAEAEPWACGFRGVWVQCSSSAVTVTLALAVCHAFASTVSASQWRLW